MRSDPAIRDSVVRLLRGGGAHAPLVKTLEDWPAEARGAKPPEQPHTAWRLLEHIRIAQSDILQFSRDASYVSPEWPSGYWPDGDAPPDDAAWDVSVRRVHADLDAMVDLVLDPETDILAPLPWGDGATILREALLVADHNAYHQGQLTLLRRLLGLSV